MQYVEANINRLDTRHTHLQNIGIR